MPRFFTKFRICELFGIQLYVDMSFAFILLMFLFSGGSLELGLAAALLLAISVVLHELGHSLTARAFGYATRDITISLLGGCAALIALPRKASQEFLTAIAGPAVSFALFFIGAFLLWLLSYAGGYGDALLTVLANTFSIFPDGDLYFEKGTSYFLINSVYFLSSMNLMLGLFNLLPGFPMDGGRVFRSFMCAFLPRARATYIAMIVGRVFAVLLGLNGLNAIVTGGSWGFIRILIAIMIWQEGRREYLLSQYESPWGGGGPGVWRARVSPPPYGGEGDESDITKNRD